MPDELNGQLLRLFADSPRPLADAQFVAQVSERLSSAPSVVDVGIRLQAIVGNVLAALLTGVSAPLRLRYAGLALIAGAALSLWALLA